MHYACPRGVARPARSPCVGTVLTEPAGGFGVYRAPQPLALPPSCQQLVALAALKRRTVHRSWICSTLWPYAPPAKAVASLRSAVATASSRRRPPACRRHPFRGLGAGRFGGLARCGRADHAAARRFGAGRRRSSSGRRSAPLLRACELLHGWADRWHAHERCRYRAMRMAALEVLIRGSDHGAHGYGPRLGCSARFTSDPTDSQ